MIVPSGITSRISAPAMSALRSKLTVVPTRSRRLVFAYTYMTEIGRGGTLDRLDVIRLGRTAHDRGSYEAPGLVPRIIQAAGMHGAAAVLPHQRIANGPFMLPEIGRASCRERV